jgi:hypothetical protein
MHGWKRIAVVCAATTLAAGCNTKSEMRAKKPPVSGDVQTVELDLKPGNVWQVKLKNSPNPQNPKKAKTDLPKDTGPTMFVVTIKQSAPATFKTSGGLTAWEGALTPTGEKAPPPASPFQNSTQIVGPIVMDGGKTLIFFDLNYGDPVTLNYALHFNGSIPSVDPIIENGGGNWL